MTVRTGGWVDKIVEMQCASSNNSPDNDDLDNLTIETVTIDIGGGGGTARTADCSGLDIFIPAFQATVNGSGYVSDIQMWCDNINDASPTDNVQPLGCGSSGSCGTDTGTNTLVQCTTGLGITKVRVKESGGFVVGIQIRCGSSSDP